MKLIVDTSEELYNNARDYETPLPSNLAYEMRTPIANGTPLTDLTNGEVIMKMFPNNRVDIVMGRVYFFTHDDEDEDFDEYVIFNLDWWNARYGEES